jgi:hypothetical protein
MKVDLFKRQRMTAISIGHSYLPFDFFHGSSHASHIIECHFIKWTMTISWETRPNAKL